ncbi:hypothetical protein SAY87_024235 [Trapa incisa]|uniref:TFIIS N-terminal domain-containing protein n=1 Tax=Trapa incisa TaxID=236973 RepID=A0AAN7JFB2_9MYRT|nr:hypothetical protein SAY87_024235 [Trapa incisa]
MASALKTLDQWREYFHEVNCDIFAIIDRTIVVAALDSPEEFQLRKNRFVEQLFTSRLTRCAVCGRTEQAVPVVEEEEATTRPIGSNCAGKSGSQESKVNRSNRDDKADDNDNQQGEPLVSNYSIRETESPTNEIDEQFQLVEEVSRIKGILQNNEEEPKSKLSESLKRLQSMHLTIGTLQETGVGKAVNLLRKHPSKDISSLARSLLMRWQALVREHCKSTPAVSEPENTPNNSLKNPSTITDDEGGLPLPPMDDLPIFDTQTDPMEFTQFFEGMDDDGNPQVSGDKKQKLARPFSSAKKSEKIKSAKPISSVKEDNNLQMKQEPVVKHNRSTDTNPRPMKQTELSTEQKLEKEMGLQTKTLDTPVRKRRLEDQGDECGISDEVAEDMKLEYVKRKIHESYQREREAKELRKVKVVDLDKLPRQKTRRKHIQQGSRDGDRRLH